MICCIVVPKRIFSTIGVGTAETVQIHLATIAMSVIARRQDSNLFVFPFEVRSGLFVKA